MPNAGADALVTERRGVDVRQRFDGHGANSPDAWILGPSDPAAFHPTLDGYKAYTAAVNSALGAIKPPCGAHHGG